jgi:excinuclease ABC subunit A
VRQNNLKGFDLDLPLGRYIAVTGLSGSGKSSLVFDTLHAEGQRRYVETFSSYTRQFLELLDPPEVDSIENIRPSIAIQQTNSVKTSRSTVGTMTELNDYFKVWFSHVAECFDPETGEKVEDDNPQSIWAKMLSSQEGRSVIVSFLVNKPGNMSWKEILSSLRGQSFLRVLVETKTQGEKPASLESFRIDEAETKLTALGQNAPGRLFVAQDRLELSPENETRFLEAAETALRFGQGQIFLFRAPDGDIGSSHDFEECGRYSRGLHSPSTGRVFRSPSPALFSFNSPLGACPRCKGFGRTIDIDYRLVIPDRSLSIDDGAIKCWQGEVYGESLKDLRSFARKRGLRLDIPFSRLSREEQTYVLDGEPGYGEENGKTWPQYWYGLKGFFNWLEKNAYKMHVRVFLARFRSYSLCPSCKGARLQPESLCWRWKGRSLPQLYALPVSELISLLGSHQEARKGSALDAASAPADIAYQAILTRLGYLDQVGLAYLSLDRPSKTLSGGEIERVNLTSCLGTSLVDTLFVLDEPSIGLHPRDIDKLVSIVRNLTDAGNTAIVVEHDEAMICAADHVIELGPEPGAKGGHIVFQGTIPEMLESTASITGDYFSGRRSIATPQKRRAIVQGETPMLRIRAASKHNIVDLSFDLPLRRFVCLSGISGSGKSTLLDHVIYQGLLESRDQSSEDPATMESIACDIELSEIVMVDQSPLSRTPRSNPALYTEAWEPIRDLFASTPEAQSAGLNASSFSFNSGEGRCDHCEGLGYERVEMQFLSDVFVPCPVCGGKRFKPEVLAIPWHGKSVADILSLPIHDALALFSDQPGIARRLSALSEVGLDYLTLGQPLNTLSGGEAQRLKLIRYLSAYSGLDARDSANPGDALLLLDEPTTGLHRHDVKRLISVLQRLVDLGHSVVVIEHNMDVLKCADWLIELGPEAGSSGGRIVAQGTPESLAHSSSATAPYLHEALLETRHLTHTPELRERNRQDYVTSNAIRLTGARENNLKNISLEIPHRQLNVVTGVSGSGKSTLAFDIIFAEGQRRFMESMSSYARQFVEQMPRPAIDSLSGIPPAVAIEQRVTRGSRKSTVATITEVAQYLRLLYARLGVQHHPDTGRTIEPLSPSQLQRLFLKTLAEPVLKRAGHLYLCAPLIRGRKGHHQPIATWLGKQGFTLMRADGKLLAVEAFTKLDRYKEHDIEAVVSDFGKSAQNKLPAFTALEKALSLGKGSCFLLLPTGRIVAWFSTTRTDAETGEAFPELEPKNFSHNSPRGWCPSCRGHGYIFPWMLEAKDDDDQDSSRFLREFGISSSEDLPEGGALCPECHGERLNRISRAVKLPFTGKASDFSLPELLDRPASQVIDLLGRIKLDERGRSVARDIIPQIKARLLFLGHVGLGYLSLNRSTATLSGGEAQRIRLAAQLGSNLTGVLYVLDEPSIGLHAKDNERLTQTLLQLRDRGNTLLVVEHDDELMQHADHLIDLGPGAGIHGGAILAQGTPEEVKQSPSSLTGLFLAKGIAHPYRGAYRIVDARRTATAPTGWLELSGVCLRNVRNVDLKLPLGRLIMVAGPSGAGKSTLCRDLLQPAVAHAIELKSKKLAGTRFIKEAKFAGDSGLSKGEAPFRYLCGADSFKSVIVVDQSPIGKTPRSTPATYLGIFDLIRHLFASLPEAKVRGYEASRFSFNTSEGRCPVCEGAGRVKLEMAFLPDAFLPCDACGGSRYSAELGDLRWNGKNIGEVLAMSFSEAASFFSFHSQLKAVCCLMVDCGLGYLNLGQSSPTLSGGEAQRLKLVTELSRGLQTYTERSRGIRPHHLYVLEEPTIGLHLSDCEKLIHLLHALVDQGHTVVVIEHHLDLLAEADWIIEMGPGGGPEGGHLLYQGALAGLLKCKNSPTAPYLRSKLEQFEERQSSMAAP